MNRIVSTTAEEAAAMKDLNSRRFARLLSEERAGRPKKPDGREAAAHFVREWDGSDEINPDTAALEVIEAYRSGTMEDRVFAMQRFARVGIRLLPHLADEWRSLQEAIGGQ